MNIYTSEVEMLRAECKEWEKVCEQHLRYIDKLKKQLKEALANHIPDAKKMVAQPEQEPSKNFEVCEIGARFDGASQQHIPFVVIEFEPVPVNSEYDAKGWKDRDLFVSDIKNTPPQRTWVGLTDDEWDEMWIICGRPYLADWYNAAEAIEAKLKEKNT